MPEASTKGNAIRSIAEADLETAYHSDAAGYNQIRQFLDKTLHRAAKILEMIRGFREISQRPAQSSAGASIHECVHQVLRAMQYEFPLNKITVLKILPHHFPPLALETEHLEAILFELIASARRAIGANAGMITIEAEEKSYPSLENQKSPRRFCLRVSDTGPGIAEDALADIFDPMAAAKDDRADEGMGLYLVKKLVDYHGGSIRVSASPNGNSFYVEFPEKAAGPKPQAANYRPQVSSHSRRYLKP